MPETKEKPTAGKQKEAEKDEGTDAGKIRGPVIFDDAVWKNCAIPEAKCADGLDASIPEGKRLQNRLRKDMDKLGKLADNLSPDEAEALKIETLKNMPGKGKVVDSDVEMAEALDSMAANPTKDSKKKLGRALKTRVDIFTQFVDEMVHLWHDRSKKGEIGVEQNEDDD